MARLPGRVQGWWSRSRSTAWSGRRLAQLAQIVMDGELHKDGGTGIVLIFNLSLGQSGLVMVSTSKRASCPCKCNPFVHLAENLHLLGFKKAGVHGLLRMFPVGHNAQALEAFHLDADILFGIGRGRLPGSRARSFPLRLSFFFLMMALSMGIPWLSQPGI